jgi:membrane fusion protein
LAHSRTTFPFRDAACRREVGRAYGDIVLARPIAHTTLTLIFAIAAALIIAFLASFSVTRKARVAGVLLPPEGLIRVQSPQFGIVTAVHVKEGQLVHTGDVLFVLANSRFTSTQGDAEVTVSRLLQSKRESFEVERGQQRIQAEQHIAALVRRVEDLKAEAARVDEQIALQQHRVSLASDAVKRQSELRNANFVSAASVQDREAELLDQQQKLSGLRGARAANGREIATVEGELQDQRVRAKRDQESASRSVAAVEQELVEIEARWQFAVRAPHDGTVTTIGVSTGATASVGQSLATVLPAGAELEAELYAPSRAAGFVKAGMTVLLRYEAFPYQKFGQFRGQVREVSEGPMQAAEVPMAGLSTSGTEPVYRIRARLESQTVRVHGQERSLKPGMALEASVLLERRRLYEWLLDPLDAIAGAV